MSGYCWAFRFLSDVLKFCPIVDVLFNGEVPFLELCCTRSFVSCSANSYPHGSFWTLYLFTPGMQVHVHLTWQFLDTILIPPSLAILVLYGGDTSGS
jgi:hypothetical protein